MPEAGASLAICIKPCYNTKAARHGEIPTAYERLKKKKSELIAEFKKIGLQAGMSLEVHRSLSSFGYIDSSADTVIDALMECVTEHSSILMPALRLSQELPLTEEDKALGITVKIKILPENSPRTAMGIIADTFRQREGVVTGSGVIRTSGWGLHGDEDWNMPLPTAGKPYCSAWIFINLPPCTMWSTYCRRKSAGVLRLRKRPPSDQWFIECGEFPSRPWYTIQRMAYEKGAIQDGYIGIHVF